MLFQLQDDNEETQVGNAMTVSYTTNALLPLAGLSFWGAKLVWVPPPGAKEVPEKTLVPPPPPCRNGAKDVAVAGPKQNLRQKR